MRAGICSERQDPSKTRNGGEGLAEILEGSVFCPSRQQLGKEWFVKWVEAVDVS